MEGNCSGSRLRTDSCETWEKLCTSIVNPVVGSTCHPDFAESLRCGSKQIAEFMLGGQPDEFNVTGVLSLPEWNEKIHSAVY